MTGQNRGLQSFGDNFEGTVLLSGEAAVFYFTGFYTTARRPKQIGYTAVILDRGVKKFLFPEKWRLQIEEQNLPDVGELVSYANTREAFLKKTVEILKGFSSRVLWIEFDEVDIPLYLALRTEWEEIRDITPGLASLRLIKTDEEIRRLRRAAKTAVNAMEHAAEILKPGIRELEVVAELEYHMRRNGSDGVPFTMKLLSGDRSGIVTRVPGERIMQKGDLVLIDFGARCLGYSSDWTRTFCIGPASKPLKEMYELVWKMERECIAMAAPGLLLEDLVKKAQELAGSHPLGKYYNPHLGHSIGITSHEWPTLEPGVQGELKENMVITIEPGIYIPGIGGVRIEDEILITSRGYEILTGLARERFELPVRE